MIWTVLVAYRHKNLVAAISGIALTSEDQHLTTSLAIAWPMIAIIIIVYWPADVAYIEDAFYNQRESLKWER